MTVQADIVRSQRRAFAAPGGFHDRLIAFLAKALPAAIGMVAAVMILAPLFQRGEISFLLDRNKVAITNERIAVDGATYRGEDNSGRRFTVSAGSAVQASAARPVVHMERLLATIAMNDGPATLSASTGDYNYDTEQIAVSGPVNFTAADGYSMTTRNIDIDLKAKRVTGSGGVDGAVPTGTFSADRIIADLEERSVMLDGQARLRMVPGKLRIPN